MSGPGKLVGLASLGELREVEAEYLALAVFPRSGSPTCDAREVAWTGETWEHAFVLACDEPASLGPQQSWNDGDDDKGPGLFSTVTMTVPPGPVTFEVAATEPVWVTISGCDQPEWVYLSPDELQAGVHAPSLRGVTRPGSRR